MRARAVYSSLRKRGDFTRVHQKGQRKGDARLQVRVLRRPAGAQVETPLRLGIIVSKKFGSAVERNRFKRIVRAAIRELGEEYTPGWDILVLPRDAHDAKMPDIRASLHALLGALGILRPSTEGASA